MLKILLKNTEIIIIFVWYQDLVIYRSFYYVNILTNL